MFLLLVSLQLLGVPHMSLCHITQCRVDSVAGELHVELQLELLTRRLDRSCADQKGKQQIHEMPEIEQALPRGAGGVERGGAREG